MNHGEAESADCKVSMLWNWYTVDACFLSSSWQILNGGMMAASCIGVALLVVVLEVLRQMTKAYDSMLLTQMKRRGTEVLASSALANTSVDDQTAYNGKDAANGCPATYPPQARRKVVIRVSPVQQIIRAVLHAITFGVAYIVMLLAMYFNGYIIISIIVGAGLGKFVCDWLSCTVTVGEDDARPQAAGIEETTVCCQ